MGKTIRPDPDGTALASFAISVAIPAITLGLGFKLTPAAKYNEVMGSLIPLFVFGLSGVLAATFSFYASLWILRSSRLKPLTTHVRTFLAFMISACACAGAVYLPLGYMLQLTPAVY